MSKTIQLTQGKFATIDDEDFERVSKLKWYYQNGYAACTSLPYTQDGRRIKMLHTFIMNTPAKLSIDHIDGNPLNCTKINMRNCFHKQNLRNRKLPKNNTSGFKGVCKKNNRWQSSIGVNGRQIYLGLFDTPIEAARAYDEAARENFKEFARTNC